MKPDFNNKNGLLPAIIQDDITREVLMLGYMNEEALLKTKEEGRVCFYSRSKQRLWTKGESSGNFLNVKSIKLDCDKDAILIKAVPSGPVCHNGTDTCFGEKTGKGFFPICVEFMPSTKGFASSMVAITMTISVYPPIRLFPQNIALDFKEGRIRALAGGLIYPVRILSVH